MADTDELLKEWIARAPNEDHQWGIHVPGPSVAALAARLAAVPSPFLDGAVSLRALVGDIIGPRPLAPLVAIRFAADERVRRGASLGLWLFAAETVLGPLVPPLAERQATLAVDALALRLASVVDPTLWLGDDERREEAVRTFLLWNGQCPAGESPDAAREALAARDSLRFNQALAASFAEHQHRDMLMRTLRDARAQEAAARYTRE